MGVKSRIGDPLSKLLNTDGRSYSGKYARDIFTDNGDVICRLEVSFYNNFLYTPTQYA